MANRHSHKKLRDEVRRRRMATGETSQQTRDRILLDRAAHRVRGGVDLVATAYFGLPIMLATFETLARPIVLVVAGPLRAQSFTARSPLRMMRPRGVQ